METRMQASWRRLRRAAIVTLAACALAAQAGELKPLRLVAGELAPFATEHGAQGPGALVEVAQEMVRRATGTAVDPEFFPWKRAIAMVEAGPRVATLPLTRTPERESHYRWLARLYWQNFVFVALPGQLDLSDPNRLKDKHIVILRGSPHMQVLRDAGFRHVTECNSVTECMRMVKTGFADATYGGEAIHRSAAGKADDFVYSRTFRDGEIWLAGSLDIPDSEAHVWQATLASMRGDGSYAGILRKYELPVLDGRH
jgi:polar amino acid transport system substrate-binding protein